MRLIEYTLFLKDGSVHQDQVRAVDAQAAADEMGAKFRAEHGDNFDSLMAYPAIWQLLSHSRFNRRLLRTN